MPALIDALVDGLVDGYHQPHPAGSQVDDQVG